MIEVKIRDKVICWLAIIIFTFFALISKRFFIEL